MAYLESGSRDFTDAEFAWAHEELAETVKSCGTSNTELDELGRLYYELIKERRTGFPFQSQQAVKAPDQLIKEHPVAPPVQTQLVARVREEIIMNGERYLSAAEEPSTIARINATRRHADISATLGLVGPLISEAIGYFTGIDTRPYTLISLGGGALGFGMCKALISIDKNSYLPADWLFWEQKPQLDSSS